MEADWEFEIAPDAPIIDAAWPGLTDLRRSPHRVLELPEAAQFPALAQALLRLNAPGSPVWTSKCDVWQPESVDPDELDAPPAAASAALACYIDLLPAGARLWPTLDATAESCRRLCLALRALPLRQCRVDLVARAAVFSSAEPALGITAYLTACGPSPSAAAECLAAALAAFADSVLAAPESGAPALKLQ